MLNLVNYSLALITLLHKVLHYEMLMTKGSKVRQGLNLIQQIRIIHYLSSPSCHYRVITIYYQVTVPKYIFVERINSTFLEYLNELFVQFGILIRRHYSAR